MLPKQIQMLHCMKLIEQWTIRQTKYKKCMNNEIQMEIGSNSALFDPLPIK